jgi:pimeloyl-ACP methyl ester carboxylesterase
LPASLLSIENRFILPLSNSDIGIGMAARIGNPESFPISSLCSVIRSLSWLHHLLFFSWLLLAGCATTGSCASGSQKPISARGVIFVANGAGDFRVCSKSLHTAVEAEHLPLCIQTVTWSHGFGRIISDQLGHRHAREAGQQLAESILKYCAEHPEAEIYLLGHSAGCSVVLSAAESLPPNSVCRIVLLAPALPARYDLRAALSSAREGIDVFYSHWDWWYLGLAFTVLGTADGSLLQPAAGRVGFEAQPITGEDGVLYARLKQYPWNPNQAWSGNLGGHYGAYQQNYLRAYVLPLFHGVPAAAEISSGPSFPTADSAAEASRGSEAFCATSLGKMLFAF